jgi:hypothetical protein
MAINPLSYTEKILRSFLWYLQSLDLRRSASLTK